MLIMMLISSTNGLFHDRHRWCGDVDALLDELGRDPNNRLKCNVHILLCIDASLNIV